MARSPRFLPPHPTLFSATVVCTQRLSPSFQRVTVTGEDLIDFPPVGFDHWFRLFLPLTPTAPLCLPDVAGRSWWKAYLAIPEQQRPHYSNYTVAAVRRTPAGVELDIDVVLHWDEAGRLAGQVAIWASSTAAGTPVALLDQGRLFDPPADMARLHLVADETGLPAVRGILRDLGTAVTGTALIEVPVEADITQLTGPSGVEVTWLPRHGSKGCPGARALEALAASTAPDAGDYAFVVGESRLATGGRRLLHRRGLPKSRITFSGFWREAT